MRRTLLLAGLALLLAAPAPAQDDPPPLAERRREVREGTHVFRRLLADAELRPLRAFGDLATEPSKTVLIVLGDLEVLDKVPGGLAKFVRDGGAVLLASDRALRRGGAAWQALLDVAGVRINSETLLCPAANHCYKGLDYCPFVIPWPRNAPLFLNEGSPVVLATNAPSMLLTRADDDPPLPTLATLPLSCQVEMPDGPRPAVRPLTVIVDPNDFGAKVADPNEPRNYPAFMVGGDRGAGRVLVLADHSVFINEMMLPTDNQNVEFTYNAITWLRGDGRARTRALFVEEGRVQSRFDLPVRPGNIPAREALEILFAKRNEILVRAEEKLAEWEDDAVPDSKVIDWLSRQGLPPRQLAHWAATIATGLLMLLMLGRLAVRYRFGHDTTAPALVTAVGGNFPTRPLAAQRALAMIRQDNVTEAAAGLVRAWFARQGIDVPPGGEAPAFRARGGWWARRRRARRLRQLWELASGRSARRVGAPEVWKLQRELEALEAGRRRGEWATG